MKIMKIKLLLVLVLGTGYVSLQGMHSTNSGNSARQVNLSKLNKACKNLYRAKMYLHNEDRLCEGSKYCFICWLTEMNGRPITNTDIAQHCKHVDAHIQSKSDCNICNLILKDKKIVYEDWKYKKLRVQYNVMRDQISPYPICTMEIEGQWLADDSDRVLSGQAQLSMLNRACKNGYDPDMEDHCDKLDCYGSKSCFICWLVELNGGPITDTDIARHCKHVEAHVPSKSDCHICNLVLKDKKIVYENWKYKKFPVRQDVIREQ